MQQHSGMLNNKSYSPANTEIMGLLVFGVVTVLLTSLQTSAAISSKKGVGIHSGAFKCDDTWKFTGVSWWYDWRWDQGERHWAHCPHDAKPGYIPMIFNGKSTENARIPNEAKYVLGFNEPDQKGQAEMSAEDCARVWPALQHKAGNRILVSPALAACDLDINFCIKWFGTFFQHCRNCRVDKIAFHAYRCNAQKIMHAVNTLYQHFHRKIWVTEIGCMGAVSVDHDMNFMKTLLPMLERSPYVEKYAWFASRLDKTSSFLPNFSTELLDHNASKLSRLGQFYNSFHI